MTIDQLVKNYSEAWNRMDVDGVLGLMHRGAAYYDAFWMETCVGPNLRQYLEDSMREEPYRYELAGDPITTSTGCVIRYRAYYRDEAASKDAVFHGAEVLTVRDGRILTVSDFYCVPHRAELEELAEVVASRHGVPALADAGLGALKALRVRAKLADRLGKDRMYLDPDITASQLAEFLDCTLDQLSAVISKEFGTSIDELLDARRVDHARRLLRSGRQDLEITNLVARQCGFRTEAEFIDTFTKLVGVSPVDYSTTAGNERDGSDQPPWH